MCHRYHVRVEALIIVIFVDGFATSEGGTAIVIPVVVMTTTHPSRIV
jgi:hypothetical protein